VSGILFNPYSTALEACPSRSVVHCTRRTLKTGPCPLRRIRKGMNGFLLLTACLEHKAFFTDGVSISMIEHLATGIYMSVLGTSLSHKHRPPTCQYKDEIYISCIWNASYSFKDCAQLRQSNLGANTLFDGHQMAGALDGQGHLTFCDVELGCRH
jgi:hypothetical protein